MSSLGHPRRPASIAAISFYAARVAINRPCSSLKKSSKVRLLTSTALIAAALCLSNLPQRSFAADNTWQLGGVDNTNYNETTNWDLATPPAVVGDAGVFGAAGSTTIVVNAAVAPDSWTFTAAAQSYSISGAAVTFGGAGVVNNSTVDHKASQITSAVPEALPRTERRR